MKPLSSHFLAASAAAFNQTFSCYTIMQSLESDLDLNLNLNLVVAHNHLNFVKLILIAMETSLSNQVPGGELLGVYGLDEVKEYSPITLLSTSQVWRITILKSVYHLFRKIIYTVFGFDLLMELMNPSSVYLQKPERTFIVSVRAEGPIRVIPCSFCADIGDILILLSRDPRTKFVQVNYIPLLESKCHSL